MYHGLDQRWIKTGPDESPTFSPSLLVTWDFGDLYEQKRCHSFIEKGYWRFLKDCTHELAGQTVPMEPHP